MVNRPRPQRLGHVVLNVLDLQASVRFYTDIVGLQLSDYIEDQMAFLRCGQTIMTWRWRRYRQTERSAVPPMCRAGPGWSTLPTSSARWPRSRPRRTTCRKRGWEIVRGIGKHGPGENLFLVFKDPDGNYCEFYAEMVQVTPAQPYTPRVWKNDLAAFDQWHFEKFVVPPPEWGPARQDDAKRTDGQAGAQE